MFQTTVELGVTDLDFGDLGHMCVLDSINFAQFMPITYILVGRIVIPFFGHFGTAKSLTDRHRSAKMPANQGVIRRKGLAHETMMNSKALDHIYRLFIASGRTCGESNERLSQFSGFCGVCLEGAQMSLYAPDW